MWCMLNQSVMRPRIAILNDLIGLKGELSNLKLELSEYAWDSESTLLTISKSSFISVAHRYLNDSLSDLELEDWADTIECRDDIDFDSELIREYIYELANPSINGKITKGKVTKMVSDLAQ